MPGWTETHYAMNGDVAIAYRTCGEGERDILFVPNWFTNVEVTWDMPAFRPWLERLATLGRIIIFDQPGTGASDPIPLDSLPTLEQWADSIRAVLDTVDSKQTVILTTDG